MHNDSGADLICHLEALRKVLAGCLLVTVLLFMPGFWCAPYVIDFLIKCSFPEGQMQFHYFSPLELFWVHLKLALILALAAGYPVNISLIWKFIFPALYRNERKALRFGITVSAMLFGAGVLFCIFLVLPLLMRFAAGFATDTVQPVWGIANFINLAGWMMLAFGVMFQVPMLVLIAVKCGLLTTKTLAEKRPFVIIFILIIAAILTPPDVVSQLLLAVPSWILFESGLFLARRIEKSDDGC